MEENILLERLLTNKFTFGFELEGFCRDEKLQKFQEDLDTTFGKGGNFHDDCSLELTGVTSDNQGNAIGDNDVIVRYTDGEYFIGDSALQEEWYESDYNRSEQEDLESFLNEQNMSPIYTTSFEYSSPVLDFTPANIKKIWEFMERNLGANKTFFTNASCGFHHHISFEGITGEDAAWILSQIAMDNKAIDLLDHLEDEKNSYGINKYIFSGDYSKDEYLGELRNAIEQFDFEKIVSYLNTEKFSLLNNHRNKTLEWRGPREFMDTNDINLVKKFYQQLWKVIRLFSQKLDLKEINGMSKENYMKGLAEVNKGRVFRFYPNFKLNGNHLLDDDSLQNLCNKIVENPNILLSLVDDKRICDQVIQKLFNMNKLRKTIEMIDENKIPQTIYDLAYKYIPAVMAYKASEDALFRTSMRTILRLKDARYGIDSSSLPDIINYVVPKVNKELFNTEEFYYHNKLDLIQKSHYKLASYLMDTLDEGQIDDLMQRVFSFHDMSKEDLCKFIESVPDSVKNTKTFATNIAIEVIKRPYLIKYIDELSPYMLVSIMAKASANNRTEEVRQELLASGKVNERELDQAANYLVRFYKHDFGGDFE